MRCSNCSSLDTQVKDSRPTEDSSVIRRRRVCLSCNFRFTTFERVQLRELVVIKRNGRRVPFDRDKLLRSVQIALRTLDDVAYVRFASVYRNFREAKDFETVLDELSEEGKPGAAVRK